MGKNSLFIFAICAAFVNNVYGSFCGKSGVPFSFELLPSGQPVLGCARPSCFGWDADGTALSNDAQFYRIHKKPDGFFRKESEEFRRVLGEEDSLNFRPKAAECTRTFESESCSGDDEWVAGIAPSSNYSTLPLGVQCCKYSILKDSEDRGTAVVNLGQIVIGGEIFASKRQYAFDYIKDVVKHTAENGNIYFDVTIRRMPCLPLPEEMSVKVEPSVMEELNTRFSGKVNSIKDHKHLPNHFAFQAPIQSYGEAIAPSPDMSNIVPNNNYQSNEKDVQSNYNSNTHSNQPNVHQPAQEYHQEAKNIPFNNGQEAKNVPLNNEYHSESSNIPVQTQQQPAVSQGSKSGELYQTKDAYVPEKTYQEVPTQVNVPKGDTYIAPATNNYISPPAQNTYVQPVIHETSYVQQPAQPSYYPVAPQTQYYGAASGGAGCCGGFYSDTMVQTIDGRIKPVSELEVNKDWVLSRNGSDIVYSQVTSWLHKDADQVAEFIKISLDDGKELKITGLHFIYKTECTSDAKRNNYVSVESIGTNAVFAKDVNQGDCLYALTEDNQHFVKRQVVSVETIEEKGIYAPMTGTGDIVVEGILASCENVIHNTAMHNSFYKSVKYIADFIPNLFKTSTNDKVDLPTGITLLIEIMNLVMPKEVFAF
uniref:HintN domain-containing protein n=1 Tax=Rhabditophanes sp. KR3021 TaxID=114890 RepID=A0AC35TUF7_9BILA